MSRRTVAVVLGAVALVATGCPGEIGLDDESPIVLTIYTPPEADEVVLSARDAEALGLERRSFSLEEGPGYRGARITTTLVHSAGPSEEYCFTEPVTVRDGDDEQLLIEPGECFGSPNSLMDRAGIEILEPSGGSEVPARFTVEVDNDVRGSNRTLYAIVDGDEIATASGASSMIAIDLSDVSPGPVTLRIEARASSGWIYAADVVELVVTTDP